MRVVVKGDYVTQRLCVMDGDRRGGLSRGGEREKDVRFKFKILLEVVW